MVAEDVAALDFLCRAPANKRAAPAAKPRAGCSSPRSVLRHLCFPGNFVFVTASGPDRALLFRRMPRPLFEVRTISCAGCKYSPHPTGRAHDCRRRKADGQCRQGCPTADRSADGAPGGPEPVSHRADAVRYGGGVPEAGPGPAADPAHAAPRDGSGDSREAGQRAGEGVYGFSRAAQHCARPGEGRRALPSQSDAGRSEGAGVVDDLEDGDGEHSLWRRERRHHLRSETNVARGTGAHDAAVRVRNYAHPRAREGCAGAGCVYRRADDGLDHGHVRDDDRQCVARVRDGQAGIAGRLGRAQRRHGARAACS